MQQLKSQGNLLPSIEQYLRRFVLRRRRLTAMRAGALALLLANVWLLAFAVVDRFYALPSTARAVMLLSLLIIVLQMIRQPLAALLRRRIDWRAAAEQLEDSDPRFNEMLATVVSHSLAGHSRETSEQLVARLVTFTESRISVRDSRRSVPLAPAVGAVAAAGVGLVFVASLCTWTWLGLPLLLARQLLPFANIPAVTTTRLEVSPGAASIVQGRPVIITARAAPLLGSAVLLRTSADGRAWTSAGMTPTADGLYTFQIPSLSRDFHYQIIAGDAAAGPYVIRVLRRPLVKEFQIRLIYPPHVHRQPLTLSSTDGAIEAPVGTIAEVTIVASEPLKSASVLIGETRIETTGTQTSSSRQVKIPIVSDQKWTLEMLSEQSVAGVGPTDMAIRALPDSPPTARLMLPAAASLLRPRDQLRVSYQAADDFALASLRMRIDVEGGEGLSIPLALGIDPRRCDDLLWIDLARCNVVVGQRVTLTLEASDGAGQVSRSTPAYILVAPKPVDPYQRRRLDDLREAATIAGQVELDLVAAAQLLDEREGAVARVGRAVESATLLIRALLRCAAGVNDPALGAAIAQAADLASLQATQVTLLNTQLGAAPLPSLTSQISAARALANQVSAMTLQLRNGLGAELALLQLENIAAVARKDDPIVAQLRREVDATLADLKLPSDQPETITLLEEVRAKVTARLQSAPSPRFAEVFVRWAQSAQPQSESLAERLMIAAQIEAVRGDADLVWARDLHITSRAARTIDALMPAAGQPGSTPDLRAALVEAFSWLSAEHDLNRADARRMASQTPVAAPDPVHDEAAQARKRIRAWAGEAELATGLAPPSDNQAGAMEANALSSQHQYESAQAIDDRLYRDSPQLRRRVEAEFNRARQIDDLTQRQQDLERSAGQLAAGEAATRQREITTRIENVVNSSQQLPGRTDSRQQGLAEIQRAQEALALLPLRLGRAEQLIRVSITARQPAQATAPATGASNSGASTSQPRLAPALQAMQMSWQRDATQRVVDRVAGLRPFAPETSDAVIHAETLLIPAMNRLEENLLRGDGDSALRTVAEIRSGIERVQIGLESARSAMLDRDPLVAAHWFAREATSAIEAPATQPAQPQSPQGQAADALRRAWDDSVHRLAEARLGGSVSLGPIIRAFAGDSDAAGPAGGDWRLQPRGSAANPAIGVDDPAGFEDALRAYFKALQAAKPEPGK